MVVYVGPSGKVVYALWANVVVSVIQQAQNHFAGKQVDPCA